MKLKSLAVITFLILCCGAAFGQTYSFAFGQNSCEYETFTVAGSVAAGTDFLTGCGNSTDGVMVGFAVDLPANSGLPVTGKVVVFADNNLDAYSASYSDCQIILVTRTKASSKRYGWVDYASCGDGVSYFLHYGYLSPYSPSQPTGTDRSVGPFADFMNQKQ